MKKIALCMLLATFVTSPAFSSNLPPSMGQPARCDALANAHTGRTGQQVPCNNSCRDPLTQSQVPCFIHYQAENGQSMAPGIWCRCNSSGHQPGFNAPGQIGIGFPGAGNPGMVDPGAGHQYQQCSNAVTQSYGHGKFVGLCGAHGNCPPNARCVSVPLPQGGNCSACIQN